MGTAELAEGNFLFTETKDRWGEEKFNSFRKVYNEIKKQAKNTEERSIVTALVFLFYDSQKK